MFSSPVCLSVLNAASSSLGHSLHTLRIEISQRNSTIFHCYCRWASFCLVSCVSICPPVYYFGHVCTCLDHYKQNLLILMPPTGWHSWNSQTSRSLTVLHSSSFSPVTSPHPHSRSITAYLSLSAICIVSSLEWGPLLKPFTSCSSSPSSRRMASLLTPRLFASTRGVDPLWLLLWRTANRHNAVQIQESKQNGA